MSTVQTRAPWRRSVRRNSVNGAGESIALSELHSPAQIAAVIERERDRSDRTSIGFSMLLLRGGAERRGNAALKSASIFLSRRLRSTDDIGWMDDGRLCVVLSATLPTGAWQVAQAIRRECADAELLEYRVYYYPSQDVGPDKYDTEVEQDAENEALPVEPMEPLFAKPMRSWKRSLDIVGAVAALLLLSPVLIAIAIAIRLTSPGPILFGQWRSGRGGVPFVMYKFRSMVIDAEAMKSELLARNEQDGPAFKIRSDPRVTRIGRFLRSTSIDELPQLWNVLKGDMSLVGPRPLPCDETANCCGWHRRRIDVAPGMTCTWQLYGRSVVSFDDWARMDIDYIRKASFLGDVKLLVGTLPVLFWRPSGC